MKRVTLTLLLVAIAIALPVGLLVARALDSAEFEAAVRQETVALRAFDEMERALSRFLEREESRTFDDYAGLGLRSSLPLAVEPFVVGYFQIEPDGRFRTPRALRVPRRPQDRGSRRERIARIETAVQTAWQRAPSSPPSRAHPASSGDPDARAAGAPPIARAEAPAAAYRASVADAAAPGVTVSLEAEEPDSAQALRELEAHLAQSKGAAYEALRDLNFGSAMREGRKQRKEPHKRGAPPTASFTFISEFTISRVGGPPLESSTVLEPQLILDPMVGRPGEAGDLILYRTVVSETQGYRQGLLLDHSSLGDWLENLVLARTGLTRMARVWFLGAGESFDSSLAPGTSLYRHRFAEPFDSMSAVLALDPLPGSDSTTVIYALAGLLAVMGAAGLFAVWRMVAVVVHFAERRNNFVASVTHELKTPLTAIRMYGEMLRDGLVPNEAKRTEYYGTITNESERLSRLIDNVLEFSRLEKGRRELVLLPGSLEPLLRESAERLGPHAEREGFLLQLEVEPDLPSVRFDRDAMVQILFNLVDNAIKYASGAERREIVLACARRGNDVELSVRDYGPGIAKRNATRIFEPFYRGESELTRNTKGTGIGLALVKELAERMGATVTAQNVEGGGFRVALSFPH